MNKLIIPLDEGNRIAVELGVGEYDKEISIYLETDEGAIIQDLAIIRPTYKAEQGRIKFNSDSFEILVWGNEQSESYTNKFTVPLYRENDE